MTEKEQIQKAMAVLHASDDCILEVMQMAEKNTYHGRHLGKRAAAVALVAVLALALAAGALAYFDPWGWISNLHRDAETERRGEIAQEAVEQFIQRKPDAAEPSASIPADTDMETAKPEVRIDETVLDLENGYTYKFSVAEWKENAGKAYVQIDETGRITWLDLRALYPYPKPENCPPEYLGTLYDAIDPKTMQPIESTKREDFYADLYLPQIAYPDAYAFNNRIQEPARAALDFLYGEGYIEVNSADVEYLCFDVFNGGSAQIDALMKNGDIYHIYLQPDDLTPTGFMLRTAEELDSHGWRERYDALFEAMRDHTLEEYRGAQQAEYTANGVG